ncbi:phosphatidylserine decarboxylase proenzyme 2 [Citrus sinensis]|nr:phosphatidylserine decarboxylase proenzyme 2 [Citrus sinensis]
MGHGSSKEDESVSRTSRFRKKFHLHRERRRSRGNGSNSGSHHHNRVLNEEDFAGIALLTLISVIALVFYLEKKLLLERNGPHVARISVFEFVTWCGLCGVRVLGGLGDLGVRTARESGDQTNRLSKSNLEGYCEVDLLEFLTKDSDTDFEVFDLLDPSSSNKIVGKISLSCSVEDPIETEKSFARRILSIVDGQLSFKEFSDLISAFGNQVAANKKEELFKAADKNGDGVVSVDELAALLALQQEKEPLMNCCPVCGETLEVADMVNTMIHLTLCFDEGTGNQVMTGGFLTDKQASNVWMFKLSEWGHFSSYDVGLNSGSRAHILVFDRRTKRLVEELIDVKIVMSMRAIYQSKIGLGLMDIGTKELLKSISEKQGRKMNSVESSKEIPKFVNFFKDQINLADVKYPLEHFKLTPMGAHELKLSELFMLGLLQKCGSACFTYTLNCNPVYPEPIELKPGARPIDCMEREEVAVCAADSRLMAFKSVEDSLRFWIKGQKFSIQGLLGNDICSNSFLNGTMVIFRLAPQDYHRFHLPVSGIIEQFVDIPGCLYTVNPIAVNSKYCNVFTENKRVVSIISTAHFGKCDITVPALDGRYS